MWSQMSTLYTNALTTAGQGCKQPYREEIYRSNPTRIFLGPVPRLELGSLWAISDLVPQTASCVQCIFPLNHIPFSL